MLGERTGYDNGKLVEGAYMPPQNVYGIGFGPILSDVMRDTPKKGTWTEKDLKYLWDVLQGEHDVENIEDEIMLRFGRDNPEKKSRFFGIKGPIIALIPFHLTEDIFSLITLKSFCVSITLIFVLIPSESQKSFAISIPK